MKLPTIRVVVKATGHEVTINETDFRAEDHVAVTAEATSRASVAATISVGSLDAARARVSMLEFEVAELRGENAQLRAQLGLLTMAGATADPAGEADDAVETRDATDPSILALNAPQAIALVRAADSLDALVALDAEERQNVTYDGGRKGVLRAIEERLAELQEVTQ